MSKIEVTDRLGQTFIVKVVNAKAWACLSQMRRNYASARFVA